MKHVVHPQLLNSSQKIMFRVRTQYSTGLLGYIPGVRMLIMKSKEWIIATKLEILYDKK